MLLSSASFSPELSRIIAMATHQRQGLITDLQEEDHLSDIAGMSLVHARLVAPVYFRGNAPASVQGPESGIGASFNREDAYWAAIGEACERYSASLYWRSDMRRATAAELGDDAIDLAGLIASGRPDVRPFQPDVPRCWVPGLDLATGRTRFVPAALTYLCYEPETPDEIIAQIDSTGLACGATFDDACLRALCEVIERDAFASTWLLQRKPPKIKLSSKDMAGLSPKVQRAFSSRLFAMSAYYLGQSFGVHIVATVTRSSGIGAVAASASPSLSRALEKAAAEGLHAWTGARKMAARPPVGYVQAIRSPSDHAQYYLLPERFVVVDSLFSGETSLRFDDLVRQDGGRCDAGTLACALSQAGFTATAVDVTSDDVADLGFKVARVVVPGLQPLVFGASCVTVPDTRRLDMWRTVWRLPEGPFNPHPHPFP